ncbi:MAG TPA: DsbC family protein [Noviherbaspirillum sp.]
MNSLIRMKGNLLAAILACCAMSAGAETEVEAQIHKAIEPRMGKNVKVDEVRKTPYGGLYEIRTNGDIFYTDESASYLFVGKIIDAHNYHDLTKERADQLAGIRFADLPLNEAIKTVKGDGKRVMAIFEDPNCPYCKKLHQTLQSVDNVTVYTFLLNILSDDSAIKAANIWCAGDPAAAWDNWMLHNVAAPAAKSGCKAPNDQILALGKSLRISGTPTLYFADGSRSSAVPTAQELEARLASSN